MKNNVVQKVYTVSTEEAEQKVQEIVRSGETIISVSPIGDKRVMFIAEAPSKKPKNLLLEELKKKNEV